MVKGLKLASLYKVTEKKRLIYMHLYCCYLWLTRTSRKKKIDSFRICSSVYIISMKKRVVYMHIVIYNYCYMVVFCGLPGPQEKYDSARGGSGS